MRKLFHLFLKFSKKGKVYYTLPFFIFLCLQSCSTPVSEKHGNISFHTSSTHQKSFIFSVNEEFLRANITSPIDKKHPQMTVAEIKLLSRLLVEKNYCTSRFKSPAFDITSRQEKVYDMTFAHMVDMQYNAEPAVATTYFGTCK